MAQVKSYRFLPWRHFRGDQNGYVIRWRAGKPVAEGRGLSFRFRPANTQIVQVPVDDQELPFTFAGRSSDYQEVTVQGTITYRIGNAKVVSDRLNFSLNPETGTYGEDPEADLDSVLSQLAQQSTWSFMADKEIQVLLNSAADIRTLIQNELGQADTVAELGLAITSVRVTRLAPKPEIERALQAKKLEQLQQAADDAATERRRAATEAEAKIAHQDQDNRIELEEKRASFIEKTTNNQLAEVNARAAQQVRTAQGQADAAEVTARSEAAVAAIKLASQVEEITQTGEARAEAEKAHLATLTGMDVGVLHALALREVAGNLHRIQHLSITPDLLTGLLGGSNGNGAGHVADVAQA